MHKNSNRSYKDFRLRSLDLKTEFEKRRIEMIKNAENTRRKSYDRGIERRHCLGTRERDEARNTRRES